MCKLDESVQWSSITNAFSLCTVRWDLSCAPLSLRTRKTDGNKGFSQTNTNSHWHGKWSIISFRSQMLIETSHWRYTGWTLDINNIHYTDSKFPSSHKFRLKNYEGEKYVIFPATTTTTLFKEKMEILCCFMFPFSPDISCENIKNAVKCVQQWGLSVRQEKTNWIENIYTFWCCYN